MSRIIEIIRIVQRLLNKEASRGQVVEFLASHRETMEKSEAAYHRPLRTFLGLFKGFCTQRKEYRQSRLLFWLGRLILTLRFGLINKRALARELEEVTLGDNFGGNPNTK